MGAQDGGDDTGDNAGSEGLECPTRRAWSHRLGGLGVRQSTMADLAWCGTALNHYSSAELAGIESSGVLQVSDGQRGYRQRLELLQNLGEYT